MGLIVQKYGGTSVRDAERVMNVANRVAEAYDAGNNVVVVVSAQGDTTDDLIEKARETIDPEERGQILHDAEKIIVHDDPALVPVVHGIAHIFRRSYIRNASYNYFSTMGMSRIYTSGRK